ncbi:hypothetical protein ACFQ78_33095 [Streptomyces sp. NPDC056519]|uniref:hypothetical protein n=1 Tax=Streptomyces sp. NPDC056519 TaxID=3345849 RepID=UPI0036D01C6A
MSMVIAAASIALPRTADTKATTVRLAGRAARETLSAAGVSPDSVGMLINTGVYREANRFEPALAAMVQKEVGINLDYLADPVPNAAFSFDLMNGACGVLNAVQVAQAVLDTDSADRILVTAADVHPGGRADADPDYPYADLGGAWLLARGAEPGVGFGAVRWGNGSGPTGVAGYLDTATMGGEGRRRITVKRRADRVPRLLDLAASSVVAYAQEQSLDLRRSLLLSSRPCPDFASLLAARLGLDPASVLAPGTPGEDPRRSREPHTAAPILGYLAALDRGPLVAWEQVLFVSVGAGPSVACASYRPQGA